MVSILIPIILFVFGACLGSFAGAMVWRLRARQLRDDKKHGDKVDAKELKRLKPLADQPWLSGRSLDLDTGKQLAWYDLLPVVSWLALGGKSRFSGKSIGVSELLVELGLGAFFVVSYLVWPAGLESWQGIVQLVVWLASGVLLAILFVYDARWSLLPSSLTALLVVLGAFNAGLEIALAVDPVQAALSVVVGVAILSGLYLMLWYVSKQRWIGFGDVVLGLGLALLLARWDLAFLALFLANFIGLVFVLPGLVSKKLAYTSRIPFGPFMIVGAIIAALWGDFLILGGGSVIDSLTYRLWYN